MDKKERHREQKEKEREQKKKEEQKYENEVQKRRLPVPAWVMLLGVVLNRIDYESVSSTLATGRNERHDDCHPFATFASGAWVGRDGPASCDRSRTAYAAACVARL